MKRHKSFTKNQFNLLSLIFILLLLLLVPNLAAAVLIQEAFEIPYQINNSDRIVIGTVSGITIYSDYTIATITVDEWLYNPQSAKTIEVRTETGTNTWTEDQPIFTPNEPVLLMLSDRDSLFDEDLDKQLFTVSVWFAGEHPVSARNAVIESLKAQGKWKGDIQTVNKTNETGIKDGITNNSSNNSENADNTPQSLPLNFSSETLDKLKNDPDFIAAYGSIPAFGTSEERQQWLDKLDEVYQGVISEMSKYEYPNGPVISFGYTIDGVIQVGVNQTVEKPFMDEVYKVFDSKASLIGIKEVPVVFVHQDLAVPTLKPVNKKTANLPTSGDKNPVNSRGNKSSKINSTPGFELLGSLTCLYVVWMLRKK
jgi:hypothetical protein